MGRILVALGGNALQRAGGLGTWPEQVAQMRSTATVLASLVADGQELIVTHGNGPQVGVLLRQNELSERELPRRPMDVLGAETQGQIGYLIEQELTAALVRAGAPRVVLALVSRTVVSRRDRAFSNPSKPVGRYYTEAEARTLRKREGWKMVFDGARGGWRRVVPSPTPLRWVEGEGLQKLLPAGWGRHLVPVVTGGGGVPVVEKGKGVYEGVEAVIDKDRTAALVAATLGADTLAILTDVPAAAIGFRKPWEKWLGEVRASEMDAYHRRGEFDEGSMGPKVEAALGFLSAGGLRAIITDAPSLGRAMKNETGTRVIAD
ncbi:MAG TPA: carbamate kinase [Thermoplasmata archaeon]|nr:carbamate kinase [Thermoplasmata archaeon]